MEYIIVFVHCCPWCRRDICLSLETNVLRCDTSLVSTKCLCGSSDVEWGRDILQFDSVKLDPKVGSGTLENEIREVG